MLKLDSCTRLKFEGERINRYGSDYRRSLCGKGLLCQLNPLWDSEKQGKERFSADSE